MNKDVAIIVFKALKKNIQVDLETPLTITANDFVLAMNAAYDLGIDTTDIKNCYLIAENPIALLKGNKLLSEFGIRDGSTVLYTE